MGLFDLFRSTSKKEKLGHLKSIVAMAMADGQISKEEEILIAAICKREGLTIDDVKKCFDSNITYPANADTRKKYLVDMLAIMVADGKIDDNELMFFKVTARALGFQDREADVLVQAAIRTVNQRSE